MVTKMKQEIISIHVPAWGTTSFACAYAFCMIYFNPRSRVGNDETERIKGIAGKDISIHVPAWGTTAFALIQSRILVQFQSTFPRGERPSVKTSRFLHQEISIHVPAWGTTHVVIFSVLLQLFQSTFPRGERRYACPRIPQEGDFNPRSRVGNDYLLSISRKLVLNFNPRSRVGNDVGRLEVEL